MEPEPPIEELLASAVRSTRRQRPAETERLCGLILERVPGHGDALHVLALSARARGDVASAVRYIRRVRTPSSIPAVFHRDAAEIYLASGDAAAAEAEIRTALELAPQDPAAWRTLAAALLATGRLVEARDACERALRLRADAPEPLVTLAAILHLLGEYDGAFAAAERAAALAPALVDAYLAAAAVESARHRFEAALAWLDRIPPSAAADPQALRVRADVLLRLIRADEALEAISRASAAAPESAEIQQVLGDTLKVLGRDDEALAAYGHAARLKPQRAAVAHVSRSIVLMELGRLDDAQAALDAAFAASPDSPAAWHAQTLLRTYAPGDPALETMERALASTKHEGRDERVLLRFALGKAWLDAGDHERAFAHLQEGNRLHRSTYSYDVDATVRRFEEIAHTFSAELFAKLAHSGPPSGRPIFVVGMPRSGTSLVEQILSSHSRVHGAGELLALSRLAAAIPLETLDRDVLRRLGDAYLAEISKYAPAAARVVDKMPTNFVYAGLIALALPDARIVHCRRDPVDTCLSCYAKYFGFWQPFAYDLNELGRFYRAYEALMRHWASILPADRLLDVDYEDIVGDLDATARRLVAFCRLEWEEACLSFHATLRPVRTASAVQVRRPLYANSVGRGKALLPYLGPLLEGLGLADERGARNPGIFP